MTITITFKNINPMKYNGQVWDMIFTLATYLETKEYEVNKS